MPSFSELEQTLLEALVAGPSAPRRFERQPTPEVEGALARLEGVGAIRMAGSSDVGPWMLTPRGHRLLWDDTAADSLPTS